MRNLDSIFDGAERSAANPFREDVFASGITPLPGVTEIHGEAMTRCIRAFESLLTDRQGNRGGSGRTILIAAPRAGFGKSHLIGRVRAVTESLIAPVALPFDPARSVGWETMLVSIFNQYRSSRCPQHPGCSLFDETARFFQSQMVRMALERGAIDEKEIPETEIALRLQFREVFDPRASNRMVPWLSKRSPEILDAVAGLLGRRWRLEFDDLVFWNRFFQDSTRPKTTAFEQLKEWNGAAARDRLTQFLRIAADCRPVAFIADHLDGFFGSDSAGMRIAEILTELRFAVPRSVTLLCLNEDVWKSIFEEKIPSAWIDRLTGEVAPLGEMNFEEAEALLRGRLRDTGWNDGEIEAWLDRNRETCLAGEDDGLYPREVLRLAAREWDREAASAVRSAPPEPEKAPVDEGLAGPEIPEPAPQEPSPAVEVSSNVFSAADESPESPPESTPEIPKSAPAAEQPRKPDLPPPPSPAPSVTPDRFPATSSSKPSPTTPPPTSFPDPDRRPAGRMDDAGAAARAAGIDLSRGLTNIEAIIADIRGEGASALSETRSPGRGGSEVPPRQEEAFPPPQAFRPGEGESEASSASGGDEPRPGNPFWARDINGRFRELEAEFRHSGSLEWQPYRIRKVIHQVGGRFPAVAQSEETVHQRPCLTWRVRGALVCMGFEAPEHFAYWSTVLGEVVKSGSKGKLVLFSHASAPFNYDAIAAMGASDEVAMRHVDVIEMSQGDLAILYAAERLLEEGAMQGTAEEVHRAVARQLDPFWRRIGKPLGSGTGAAS